MSESEGGVRDLRKVGQEPLPGWCRTLVRLVTQATGARGAVVGLRTREAWKTTTYQLERIASERLAQVCEKAAAEEAYFTDALPAEEEQSGFAVAGVPLRDWMGDIIGALCVVRPDGETFDRPTENILTDLATLVSRPNAASESGSMNPRSLVADPAFFLRTLKEMQPPLSDLAAQSNVLRREVIGTSRQRAQVIHSKSTRLIRVLKSVLDLVRIETGPAQEAAIVDLTAAARDVIDHCRSSIRERGLYLNFEAPDAVVEAMADIRAVREILTEVLTNAIQVSEEGSVTIRIVQTPEQAQIVVIDSGPGIDEALLPLVFDPFQKSDKEAAGLGLTIAKRLAERVGGDIRIENAAGGGAACTMSFPPARKMLGEDDSEREVQSIVVRHDVSDRPLLLLLEDAAISRRVMERILGKQFDIVSVATAADAIDRAREYHFNVLVLDISLGGSRTGVDVLQEIRRMVRYADVPAVACTAYNGRENRERFLSAGFDEYVSKPFRADQLLEVVSTVRRPEADADEAEFGAEGSVGAAAGGR